MTEIIRVAAYGLIIHKEHILLCKLAKLLPEHRGEWTLPGGGMDFGEHPEQTVIRETMEETGVTVAPIRILGVDTLRQDSVDTNKKWHSVRIIYQAEYLTGELVNELNGTTDKCEWHPLESISDLDTQTLVDKALEMNASKSTVG